MPIYKVKSRGFYNGELYDPEGKRKTLVTDTPFPKGKLPSWLVEMPKESAAARKKREACEAESAKKNADEVRQGGKDITDASFMGGGNVTTL